MRRAILLGTVVFHLALLAAAVELKPPPVFTPVPEPVPVFTIQEITVINEREEDEERETPDEEVAFVDPPEPLRALPLPHAQIADLPSGPSIALPQLVPVAAPSLREGSSSARLRGLFARDHAVATLAMLGTGSGNSLTSLQHDELVETAVLSSALGGVVGGVPTGLLAAGGGVIGAIGSGSGAIGGLTASGTLSQEDDLLRRYTQRIRAAILRAREYPAAAEDAGLEGRVTLNVTIDGAGTILEVTLAKSSGHSVLDESLLASVRRLANLPHPPPELQWERKTFRISVHFELDDL